ncbi:MAG: hypothetical protein DWQ34_12695 [Planctomycetota bacterium]|nr:MAG: hypothetical protein DWQ34_12695 [Planctomycetota bacterium]REK19909.1 MAG: hypothetical protein DWQ41_26625 [Planctomycetota bacterium]REK27474.1 MAG: hypothetical protein DWQ45_25640 [Planctomycetota bacterium]
MNKRILNQRWESVTDEMAEVLRNKTGVERLAIADSMWRSVRRMLLRRLRREYPAWSEEQCSRETARRMSHGAV